MKRLDGQRESDVSTDPITEKKKKKAIYLVSCLLRHTIPLTSESPKQSEKTKHLVRGPRLRQSSDPSSATQTAWAKCVWALKTNSPLVAQPCGEESFLSHSDGPKEDGLGQTLPWCSSLGKTDGKHSPVKGLTVLRMGSARGKSGWANGGLLKYGSLIIHLKCCTSLRKLSRACAFTEFYRIC